MKKGNKNKTLKSWNGFPLQKASTVVAAVLLAISVLLLVATARVARGYKEINRITEEYMEWQSVANEMRTASDYLTEQVRMYVETGEMKYLNGYFTEINYAKRRENVLETFRPDFEGLPAFIALETALEESNELTGWEVYAARLKIVTTDVDPSEYPEAVASVVLTAEDESLTANEKIDRARQILFGKAYRDKKETIYEQINVCIDGLAEVVREKQSESMRVLRIVMIQERSCIVLFLVAVIALFLMNVLMIYRPLLQLVSNIKHDIPLDIGRAKAYEIRFLARAYNKMLEKNRENEAALSYKATHDPLTAVRNRNGLEEEMRKADNTDTAIVIVDIDDYKVVNDRYGHAMGDRILQDIAAKLVAAFPDSYIARIGGDEFCVILQSGGKGAEAFREYIRSEIDDLNDKIQHNGELPPVSISCGVGFCKDKTGKEAMRCADKALYTMKRHGKHGCCLEKSK